MTCVDDPKRDQIQQNNARFAGLVQELASTSNYFPQKTLLLWRFLRAIGDVPQLETQLSEVNCFKGCVLPPNKEGLLYSMTNLHKASF